MSSKQMIASEEPRTEAQTDEARQKPILTVEGLGKVYPGRGHSPDYRAVVGVSFTLHRGEVVTILGPSGCGKSTVMNCIAGLTAYTEGKILLGEQIVTAPGPERAMVFQQASLLPWRTVIGNVMYGMELEGLIPKREQRDRARWAVDLVNLSKFTDYYPSQLSGGMKQRTNLARALATGSDILLMDEPFGALDALTKERLQLELQKITIEASCSTIFITHDIDEALFLGDKVIVMGSAPGHIKRVIDVGVPRPREHGFLASDTVQSWRQTLWQLLCEDADND